jgi:hypothetical protein
MGFNLAYKGVKKKWESSVMHDQYIRSIGEGGMFLWPLRGDLK